MKPSESWRYTFPSNLFNSFVDPQLLNSNAKFQRYNSGGVLFHPLRNTCKKQYQQHVTPPWKLTLSMHIHWKLMLGWKMMINLFFKWVPFQRGFHFRYSFMVRGKKNLPTPLRNWLATIVPGRLPSLETAWSRGFFPLRKKTQKTG